MHMNEQMSLTKTFFPQRLVCEKARPKMSENATPSDPATNEVAAAPSNGSNKQRAKGGKKAAVAAASASRGSLSARSTLDNAIIVALSEQQRQRLGGATHQTAPRRSLRGKVLECKVLDCYDGDTITVAIFYPGTDDLCSVRVRLVGIDTPELRKSRSDPDRELHISAAKAARRWVRAALDGCAKTTLVCFGEDDFGRVLGQVFYAKAAAEGGPVQERNLCAEMIDARVAKVYAGKRATWTREDLQHIVDVSPSPPARRAAAVASDKQ